MKTEYDDLFEMLVAVKEYSLRRGERLIPTNSVKGTHVGFCTADGAFPSVSWTISVRVLKAYEKGTEWEQDICERLKFFHTRKDFLSDLRRGRIRLTPPSTSTPESVPDVKSSYKDSNFDEEFQEVMGIFES